MNKNSRFLTHVLPWILFALGAAATAAVIAVTFSRLSAVVSPIDNIALCLLGAVIGFILIIMTNRQKISRRDYLSIKNGMVVCWACCVLVLFTVTRDDWVYNICLPVTVGCAAYMSLYIPRYIRLKDELLETETHRS